MEDLIELVGLFKKTKFRALGAQQMFLEPGSQLALLYEGIAEGRLKTEQEVQQYFEALNLSTDWITQTKSKLKNRLVDMLLILDLKEPAYEDRGSAYAECTRKWASITVLLEKRARNAAISLLHDLLRTAQRFEFTEITVEILRTLSLHQGLVEGNQYRFGEVEALLEEAESLRVAEYRIQRVYLGLVNKFVRQKAEKGQIIEKAADSLQIAQELRQKFSSYEIHLYARLIELVYYDSLNDQTTVARQAGMALDFFRAKPYHSRLAMQAFSYYQMTACFNLGEYHALEQLMQTSESFFETGTYNWFKLRELQFLANMHAGQYEAAHGLYRIVASLPSYSVQPAPIVEMWKIFEAWLSFLIATGTLSEPGAPKFKVHKFMNEVPVFSRDKSGMNVSILVAQFLHHLIAQDYGACIDRVEALAKYRQRYLKGKDTIRSQHFVRMLEIIPRCRFARAAVENSCALLRAQLVAVPLGTTNQNHEVEVMPYEAVWQIILTYLPMQMGDGGQVKAA